MRPRFFAFTDLWPHEVNGSTVSSRKSAGVQGFFALVLTVGFAVAAAESATLSTGALRVRVTGGVVEGSHQGKVLTFKGIPFASPPVGPLRWKAPQPVIPWDGLLKANDFALPCAQPESSASVSSEDCLYLNIWMPVQRTRHRLAVMVWIHGGSFTAGGTGYPVFDGGRLADDGVIVVTIAYRLGPLGFLAHPEIRADIDGSAGNFGLQDQIAALMWIQNNIAKFGGDPSRVTLFGESAGANSVSLLAASPLAPGLFQRAISQSSVSTFAPLRLDAHQNSGGLPSLEFARRRGHVFIEGLGAANLAAARRLPVNRIVTAGTSAAGPMVDEYIVPTALDELYENGRFNDVPVIVGFNSDEGALDVPRQVSPSLFNETSIGVPSQCHAQAREVLGTYPHATIAETIRAFKDLSRDVGYEWNAWSWAQKQSRRGKGSVYLYYFDVRTDSAPEGAPHGGEVEYVFGNLGVDRMSKAWQWRVSDLMRRYWINFASSGDPNGKDLPLWRAFTERDPVAMIITAEHEPASRELPHLSRMPPIDRYFACMRNLPTPP